MSFIKTKHENGITVIESTTEGLDWQRPVITELEAARALRNLPDQHTLTYLAIPWATIIDHPSKLDINQYITSLMKKIAEDQPIVIATVCQHIHFEKLSNIFEALRVHTVYASHARTSNNKMKCRVRPFWLFAANVQDPTRNSLVSVKAPGERKWLYSFTGAYMKHYVSQIRLRLAEMTHPESATVKVNAKWHYEDNVYHQREQSPDQRLSMDNYNEQMCESKFALCPGGAGNNTIRFWEALGCGTVPVVLADGFALPSFGDRNWKDIAIFVEEKDYLDIPGILAGIDEAEISRRSKACLDVYSEISGENFASCIAWDLDSQVQITKLPPQYRFGDRYIRTVCTGGSKPHTGCNDKTILVTQYFMPKDQKRVSELQCVMRKNAECEAIDEIHLLNERTYSLEELGLEQSQAIKIKQIVRNKRLQYSDFFEYTNQLEDCYVVLANSDIFFDDTLRNVRGMDFDSHPMCQCLLRFDCKGSPPTFSESTLFGPRVDSQDAWIFHKTSTDLIAEKFLQYFSFELGRAGCDNKLVFLLDLLGYDVCNEPFLIHVCHYHLTRAQGYNMDRVKPPYGLSVPVLE